MYRGTAGGLVLAVESATLETPGTTWTILHEGTEVLDRLPGAGQVVEVTALHRLLDLEVDVLALTLHPLEGR
jgi:hypothetical protein